MRYALPVRRLVVSGSRGLDPEPATFNRALEAATSRGFALHPDLVVVHGGARGVDEAAGDWARVLGAEEVVVPAQWERYGILAGKIRNWDMVLAADGLLAVWDGQSNGTSHAIAAACALGLPVHVHCPDADERGAVDLRDRAKQLRTRGR